MAAAEALIYLRFGMGKKRFSVSVNEQDRPSGANLRC